MTHYRTGPPSPGKAEQPSMCHVTKFCRPVYIGRGNIDLCPENSRYHQRQQPPAAPATPASVQLDWSDRMTFILQTFASIVSKKVFMRRSNLNRFLGNTRIEAFGKNILKKFYLEIWLNCDSGKHIHFNLLWSVVISLNFKQDLKRQNFNQCSTVVE